MNLYKLLVLIIFPSLVFSQGNYNLDLISNVSLGESGNDIWGYVDENGLEYAIVGSAFGTSIFSLEDPTNPILRYKAEGDQSVWRDIKSHNDRLYVTCDSGNDGLVIINMENAPEEITHINWRPQFEALDSTSNLRTCHNLYIDDEGYCYLAGCNLSAQGVIILDLNQDPDLPVYQGAADLVYSHDVYVQGNLMISSEINIGEFGLYDISDKTNPVLINRQGTTTEFTHNAWFSDDGNFAFTTDEKPNAYVESYDISDPLNMKFLDRYRPIETENRGVIPHNTHYDKGFLVTSWYTNGIIVIDANKPDNLVEVASYDTYQGDDGGFDGCWGAYPYLPSGLVLGSDLNTGLYVLAPNLDGTGVREYKRACYLEGVIYDMQTNNTISGATVTIQSTKDNRETSNENGVYKTGLADAGTYQVTVSHPEYLTYTGEATLNNGEVTILDVYMEKYIVNGSTKHLFANDLSISDVNIKYVNLENGESVTTSSDNNGNFSIGMKPGAEYQIFAGKWGFKEAFISSYTADNSQNLIIELDTGYQDAFNVDQGWTVISIANTGMWERAVPGGTWFQDGYANPNTDDPNDIGDECYVTGNITVDAVSDDVDNGSTILTSPVMNMMDADTMTFRYSRWFINKGGSGVPNDILEISLTNGIDTIVLETITEVDSKSEWSDVIEFGFTKDQFQPTENMQIIVNASDDSPGHLLECGFDNFSAESFIDISGIEEASSLDLEIYPNPSSDRIYIKTEKNVDSVALFDLSGRLIKSLRNNGTNEYDLSDLNTGLYMMQINVGNDIIFKKLAKN